MKSKYPLLKFLIYVAIGFIIGSSFRINSFYLIPISILALLSYFLPKISIVFKYSFISISIGLLLFGSVNRYSIESLEDSIANSFEGVYKGKITEVLSTKTTSKRFVAEGILQSNIFTKPYKCNVLFTLFDKSNVVEISSGMNFLTKSTFVTGQPKILDEDFNEKSFLISKKSLFFGTTNIKSFAIQSAEFTIKDFFFNARRSIVSKIQSYVSNEKISGVLIALTTGDKSNIDKNLQNEFSLTGTAHILAISGLHVGIFSLFIYVLIGSIRSQQLKLIVFLIVLWSFILFVGCPPSAVRAAFMASIFMYFVYIGKSPNLLNILLLTIIVFVIINPTIIYSISFQLSIFAISGIFMLYKPIYNSIIRFIKFKNKFTIFIASSFAISFAATIPTSFLSAYYFNTFSIIYPIANLIILPLMTLATFESILFAILSTISVPFADLFIKTAYLLTDISIQINSYFVRIGEFNLEIDTTHLLILSVLSSLLLIYILMSKSNRSFIFRAFVSLILSYIIINDFQIESKSITILPREQFSGLMLDTDSSMYIVIADRKKYDYLKLDFGLIKHITNTRKSVYIFKTGNVSINIVDKLKDKTQVKHKFISIDEVDRLSTLIKKKYLYRITKIDA